MTWMSVRGRKRGPGLLQAAMLTRTQTMDPIDPDAAWQVNDMLNGCHGNKCLEFYACIFCFDFFPLPLLLHFFHGWRDLTNGVLTLNSALDGAARGAPFFSIAPPDIVAQLNVNASESISLAQLELRRRWDCVNRQQCISFKRKGVFSANDLITNSPAHFVEPHTLWIAVDLCHKQLGYCMQHTVHKAFGILLYIPSTYSIFLLNTSDSARVYLLVPAWVNSHNLTDIFMIKRPSAGSTLSFILTIEDLFSILLKSHATVIVYEIALLILFFCRWYYFLTLLSYDKKSGLMLGYCLFPLFLCLHGTWNTLLLIHHTLPLKVLSTIEYTQE